MAKPKLFIITTIPLSLRFYRGQVGVLRSEFEVEAVSSEGELLDQFGEHEQVKTHAVNMHRNISLLNDLRSLYHMTRLLRRERPDMVLGSTPKAGLISMLASRLTGIGRRVYYLHGLRYDGASGLKKWMLRWMERLSCMCASHVFAVSFGVKRRLSEDRITTKRIKVIGKGSVNGIDVEYFDRENTGFDDVTLPEHFKEGFVFGFIGRLVGDKGINELVRSFVRIERDHPDTRLLLVGDYERFDPVSEEVKQIITDHHNIHMAGFQTDIRPWLMVMDLFVFPSYREGFGMALMEAMAMGVPAISSDITGCNEIIDHEKNGLLFEPRNEQALYHNMLRILDDKTLFEKLRSSARAQVVEKYEQKKVWENTLQAYTELMHD